MLKRKYDKTINIMQLRFFCQVAQRGSVSRAADDLFRTQSAITRAIRDLEAALNVTLFERHYSGMVATEYGRCILPRALRAIEDLQAIPALMQKLHPRSTASGALPDSGWLFNTRRLEIFLQLYHVNHTQTVASQLGITQPAVSAALKILEKGAGSALFRRTPEGVRPTPAADLLYPPISRALNELENIWSDLAARRGVLEGSVRIGALPLSRTQLLPAAISAFLARYPGIMVMTNESPYESLVSDMRAGHIDFIIGALRQDEDLPDLRCEALFEEDMLILLRNGHPLLRHPDPQSQLATAQWVLPRSNAPARHLLEKAFLTLGLPLPQPTVETGDAAMVRGLLRDSDMLAAVSASQMRFEIDNGLLTVLPVSLPDTTRRIGLTFRAGSLPSPATQALLQFIQQHVAQG
ncbi:LysR family transcriptional regulator of gallate degradation [Raoultella sp. BIGb0399]|uniref:LysR family transcriptional regulator n=1 Tax=Enterobacteriaceae TaxID=543 RepID=UPI000F4CA99E|nr:MULTISPECIES: LysR family transcriptional regulator [Enterobacteriaceae]QNK06795.1 LysR family transcriptional regulator [Enterobacter sp. JUb54]ROS09880.1 LysR family transcriptional regulator of gallate degradation [Raoultella sp. BIGb0399]